MEWLNPNEKRVKPKYHIFGHIHEGYGVTTNGETVFANCSVCDHEEKKPIQEPFVFDLPVKYGLVK